MGAARLASGETLVDAISVGLVCDDENTAVGRMQWIAVKRAMPTRRAGMIRIVHRRLEKIAVASHDDAGRFRERNEAFVGPGLDAAAPRLLHAIGMNGLLAICGICREIMR